MSITFHPVRRFITFDPASLILVVFIIPTARLLHNEYSSRAFQRGPIDTRIPLESKSQDVEILLRCRHRES
jgi:hypothetical protein